MDAYIYLIYAVGLLFNGYLFWALLQLALASRGSARASEKWIAIVSTPFMQLIGIRGLSCVLAVAMGFQLVVLMFLVAVSVYTGEPISLARER